MEVAIWNEPSRLVFVAFDILHLDDRNLSLLPLLQRKRAQRQLDDLASGRSNTASISRAIFRAMEKTGLNGVISKRVNSRYRSGPSKTWLKAKLFEKANFGLLGAPSRPGGQRRSSAGNAGAGPTIRKFPIF
nr:hypothetical protein [Mesorhizobium sp. CA8]